MAYRLMVYTTCLLKMDQMLKAHIAFWCLAGALLSGAPAHAQKAKKPVTKATEPTMIARPPYALKHKIGDRVQVYYQNWYPATIREVGKGDYKGFYRVAFDDFDRQRWVDDDEIRIIPKGATHPLAFLSGTYQCYRRTRPKKEVLVDELYLEPNGDYHMRDDLRPGRIFLAKNNEIVWQGGALDDADAHVDGQGMLHIVRTRHEHWTDSDPQQMQCVLK